MGVVREDVVKIGFDIDDAGLGDLKKMLNDLKKGFKDTDKTSSEAEESIDKIAKTDMHKVTDGAKRLASTLGTVATKAALAVAKITTLAAAGIGTIATKSIQSYADYEQLVGGVETLFGAGGQSVREYARSVGKSVDEVKHEYRDLRRAETAVLDNAKKAFKTAGLSQNEYMQTVTSFSASLIQSLGGDTKKAADLSDLAIRDMSDNANKMGTDMSLIQNAYQGFAKQNYMMLDNLKLGYGGTKTEMERLLKDAGELAGKKFNISSYADVIEAIHVIQDSMGITGTTAKEAEKTITGSFNSLKGAWGNMLNALVLGGDDFDRCLDDLIDSAKIFMKNLIPALTKSLGGIGEMIEELAPIIEKEFPTLVDELLPPLIKAAASLVKGLIVALPNIVKTLIEEIPDVLGEVWAGVKEAFGDTPGFKKFEDFFTNVYSFFKDNAGLIKKFGTVLLALVVGFKLFNKVGGFLSLFGGGKGGIGGKGLFGSLSSLKPTAILKGLGNLAIILLGLMALAAVFMYVAPYMAELSDMKSVGEVLLVVGLVGLLGTGLSMLAGYVGNIPVATVAKGLANIAIVMVGFGALAAVLMWVAPYMAQLTDFGSLLKTLVVIGLVGIVGTALAGLAGLIGAIPIVAVLSGLANIALALGGFGLIAAAFGALNKIEGLSDLLDSGGEILVQLCEIIGEMAGALVGGALAGLSAGLETIGENISAFATAIEPALTTFGNFKTTGLGDFASALGDLMGVLVGDAVLSFFTGGNDYAEFGTKLSDFATNASAFFTTVKDIPDESFGKMTNLFNALAGVDSLPKDGGIVGFITGEVDLTKLATGIKALGGVTDSITAVKDIPEDAFTKLTGLFNALSGIDSIPKDGGVFGFFTGEVNFTRIALGIKSLAGAADSITAIQNIPDAAFAKLTGLFNALAGINALPQSGGIAQWFTGEVSFDKIVSGLQSLTTAETLAALTSIQNIPEAAFTNLTALFNALAGVNNLPEGGGIFQWFTGDKTQGLEQLSSQLPAVATSISTFYANLNGITDFSAISSLFTTLNGIKIDTDAASKGFLSLGKSDLEKIGEGLSAFATNAATFFNTVNGMNADNVSVLFDELSTVGDIYGDIMALDSTVGTALSNIVTTMDTKFAEMGTSASTGMKGIISAINVAVPLLYMSGVYMMEGVNAGMLSMQGTLVSTAASIAAAIQDAFDVELKINSPSKVMIGKGEDWGAGGVIGIRNSIPDARMAAQDYASATMQFGGSYTPESSASTYNRNYSATTHIAPVFELHITGSSDDRALARRVKRYVSDAIGETFESYDRVTHDVREA